MYPRRLPSWPDVLVRYLAWLGLLLALWPTLGSAAATAAVPVITNIAGAVEVRNSTGSSHDIISSQIVHSGDMLVTGIDSLAVVHLADVGRVRLGPGTTTTATSTASTLSFSIASGSMCVESERPAITIQAGALSISAAADGTIFDLIRDASGTRLAVYQGLVSTQLNGKDIGSVKSGEAFASPRNGAPGVIPIQTVTSAFTALHCPDEAIIAQAMATPTPSPPASAGSGGGGGIIGILLGIAGLAALAGGHGGGGAPQPGPSMTPSPGALGADTTALSFLVNGPAQRFKASESNYTGPISAVSGDPTVATVTGSGNGPGPVTFTVNALRAGNTSITVSDNHGQRVTVSVTVNPPGSLMVDKSSLSFIVNSSQQFNASESNYTGVITATSSDPTVATVSGSGNGPGPVTFTVSPVGAGNATIIVSDNHGGTQNVSVTVVGPLIVSTNMIVLNATTTNLQFNASETAYTGLISAVSDTPSVASVSPASIVGPGPVTFTVTSVSPGTATITVTDDHGGSRVVNVTVEGPLGVSTNTLTIVGLANTGTFTASESSYSGTISAVSSNTSVATVSPASGIGPGPVTFTVTSVSVGNANIIVTDDHGGQQKVLVSVTSGTMSVTPVTLTFNTIADPPQSFTVTDATATTFTAIPVDTTIVSVTLTSSTTGSATFSVQPLALGKTTINVADSIPGSAAAVSVGVGQSPLLKKHHPVVTPKPPTPPPSRQPEPRQKLPPVGVRPVQQLDPPVIKPIDPAGNPLGGNPVGSGGAQHQTYGALTATALGIVFKNPLGPQALSVFELNYTGRFTAVSANPNVVTIGSPTALGPNGWFMLTPRNPGIAIVHIMDDHGGVRDIFVTVQSPEIMKRPPGIHGPNTPGHPPAGP